MQSDITYVQLNSIESELEWKCYSGFFVVVVVYHRGIDVVRNKIKMFAQQKVTLPKGRHKIIILDEADR